MNDHIDRQAARHALGNVVAEGATPQELVRNYKDIVLGRIEALPSADVAPVRHGHWVYTPTSPLGFTCSECGKEMCRFNYCPNCGARMDGEQND